MSNLPPGAVRCLDHGFIRLVDIMGDDDAIAEAARVSYGRGTRSSTSTRGLVRSLMRRGHTSPFEMCLSGDTEIPTFPCRGAKVKQYRIDKIAKAFERSSRKDTWAKLLWIRTVNPETKLVTRTKIKRAWKTGRRDVFEIEVTKPTRRTIKVTDNHPILTSAGFSTIEDGLSIGDMVMLNGIPALDETVISEIKRRRSLGHTVKDVSSALGISTGVVYKYSKFRVSRKTGFYKKEIGTHKYPRAIARREFKLGVCEIDGCCSNATDRHHIDENPHNNSVDNVSCLCAKHHRHMHTMSRLKEAFPCEITKITKIGEEDVYDIEVYDENHTFVANGFVVHNCEVKFHVKLPIFVARQWIRHRTANVNEMSARYSIISDDAYVPSVGAIQGQSKTDKQGRDGQVVGDPLKFRSGLIDRGYFGRQAYDDAIEAGVSRELARLHQTVAGYTEWYWKIDLHNLFHFLRLRLDHHAQYEIRVYAEAILELIRPLLPIAVGAFEDYRLGAVTFSAAELVCIGDMLAGLNPVYDGMSKTERREFDLKIKKAIR